MKSSARLQTVGIGISVLSASVLVADINPAQAASFKTTITSSDFASVSIGTEAVDKIVFDWSTDLTTGTVTETALNSWEISFFDTSGSNFFTDTVVLNGVVQTIGDNALTRTIDFRFDLDSNTLQNYNNDVNLVQANSIAFVTNDGATGQTFHVLEADPLLGLVGVEFQEYQDGDPGLKQATVLPGDTQITTQAVPEPLTIVGTAIALGFGAFFKRRFPKNTVS